MINYNSLNAKTASLIEEPRFNSPSINLNAISGINQYLIYKYLAAFYRIRC